MRFFRRIAGLFGLARDQENNHHNNDNETPSTNPPVFQETGLPRRGFGVPVQVAVSRSQPAPLLLPCTSGDGGVQAYKPKANDCPCGSCGCFYWHGVLYQEIVVSEAGLKWYAKRLRIDEDGDVADEFLDEVLPETSGAASAENEQKPFPKFEVKYSTRRAKVKTQVLSQDGKIQQSVEHQGRMQWV